MWACLGKCVHYINIIATVFTWLNAAAHLYKMTGLNTMATIQGWLISEGGVYCNVIITITATIQKPGKVYSM